MKASVIEGSKKAAVAIASMDPDTGGAIMAMLGEEDAVRLSAEIASLGEIPEELRRRVLDEFIQDMKRASIAQPGDELLAKSILEKGFGAEEATRAGERLRAALNASPFHSLREISAEKLAKILESEHPQTAALVLSYLDRQQASDVLLQFSKEYAAESLRRLARLQPAAPEAISLLEHVLEVRLRESDVGAGRHGTGREIASELLARSAGPSEREIIERLRQSEPDLAATIEKSMFSFNDVLFLDGAGIRTLLASVSLRELAVALKAAPEEVAECFITEMSEAAKETFFEEFEKLGPVRLSDIEASQERIASLMRRLAEQGTLQFKRGASVRS